MIRALAGTKPVPETWVDDQDVDDIMRGIKEKHSLTASDYDRIAHFFGPCDDLYELAFSIWHFLRTEIRYKEEDIKRQVVSCPYTILTQGWADCKCYALFTAGILDALKRQGCKLKWVYRYTPTQLLSLDIGHVFVVLNPETDNIWIDPIPNIPSFDHHFLYFVKKDMTVKTAGAIGAFNEWTRKKPGRMGSAETDYWAAVKQYSDGVANAIQVSNQSGTINTITQGIIQTASSYIPGVAIALGILKAAGSLVSSVFGPGSTAALLINDWATNPLTAPYTMVLTLFNGRTYQTDQYWMAQIYQYYVLGNGKITTDHQVVDAQVMPAAKWFIDRLNVYIPGREAIDALRVSPQAYVAFSKSDPNITTDMTRVNAASAVVKQYMPYNNVPGSWAQTVGVFDPQLIALALSMGQSTEYTLREINTGAIPPLPGVTATGQTAAATPAAASFLSGPIPWVAAAIIGVFLLTDKK